MKTLYRISCLGALLAVAVFMLSTTVPVRASDTDSRIESSARKSYAFKTYLKDDSIQIHAKDGVVTLTGTVARDSDKSLAEETIAGMPGVKRVDNRLEVKAEPATANSDTWIALKVKAALLFHRSVSAKTDVDVKGGIATLRGEASSTAEIDLTTEYAKDVEGVKGVENKMTVSKSKEPQKLTDKMSATGKTMAEAIDNASLTAMVKLTLLYHRSTSAISTTVKANNGVVMLSGKAKNTAEKDLVSKYVKDVHGVKKVINNMIIEKSV